MEAMAFMLPIAMPFPDLTLAIPTPSTPWCPFPETSSTEIPPAPLVWILMVPCSRARRHGAEQGRQQQHNQWLVVRSYSLMSMMVMVKNKKLPKCMRRRWDHSHDGGYLESQAIA